jgi:hypothetical protein
MPDPPSVLLSMFVAAVVLNGAGGWAFIAGHGRLRTTGIALVALGTLLLASALIFAANSAD